jgi:hypothetical protein
MGFHLCRFRKELAFGSGERDQERVQGTNTFMATGFVAGFSLCSI